MLRRLILLVFLSTPVYAADFLKLSVEDRCVGADEKETTLGSASVPRNQMPGIDIQVLQAREYDRDWVVTYFCPKGSLATGNYSFRVERFDDAAKAYNRTNGRPVSTYSSPVLDSSPSLVGTDIKSLLGGPGRTKYSAGWRTSRALIMISIMPNQPWEVRGSRTFVVLGETSK